MADPARLFPVVVQDNAPPARRQAWADHLPVWPMAEPVRRDAWWCLGQLMKLAWIASVVAGPIIIIWRRS